MPVKVLAGNYYKVVAIDSAEARVGTVGRVFEGWDLLYAVVVGTDVDVVDFWCTTHPGTATTVDYVGGSFPLGGVAFAHPLNPNPGTSRLTLSANAPAEGSTNILESTEYLEIECLPSGTGSDLWQADGSARIRVEIMDYSTDARLANLTAKSSTDGTTFSALSLSPNFSSAFNNGKIITDYSAAVGNSVTHVKVKPIIAAYPVRATVTVTVNGETVASNSDSSAIAIGDGYNDINVQVTAADGTTTQDYTVTVKKLPAAHLSNLEVLDEYGSLLTRPSFIASHPGQSQVIFVAPGIRRIKVKPHWPAGSTMSVEVSTTDMTYKNRTYSTATVSTSGTESGYLTISDFGGTKLNISVTETINGDSATVEYPNKYVTRELNAANADNYLNYMGLSPNPNARPTSSLQRTGAPGYFNVLQRSRSSAVGLSWNSAYQSAGPLTSWWLPASGYGGVLLSSSYTPVAGAPRQSAGSVILSPPLAPRVAGAPQQNPGSITLTPAFDPLVHEYTATVPYEVSSVFVNLAVSHAKASATVNGGSPSTPVSLEVGENVVTVVVTAESGVQRTYTVTITREPSNRPPAVATAIADATIINESGTSQASLSGVFTDPDGDDLTVNAASSDKAVATVSVSADYATLTVTAKSRGRAIVTVTAADGKGGTVETTFTVTVKAAPGVASAIADVTELEVDATHEVSMSGVFSDADGDTVTVTEASSSGSAIATVSAAIDGSTTAITAITVTARSEGTATITVTAQDADGNRVSDAFDVTVAAAVAEQQQAVALPGPVVNLQLEATEGGVIVSWSAPESGGVPHGYIVHLRPEGGGEGSGRTKTPRADKTTVTFDNLESGQTYRVWVRAENDAGKGERVRATIALPAVLPGPVTGLEVAATEDGVTVSWSAPETGGAPDGYIVHVRPEDGATGSGRTKTPKAKKTSVTFENLEAGRTYKVWVRAQNDAGKGERTTATITLPEAEPPPDQGEQQDSQSGQ